MAISFVGSASWDNSTSSTSYTITKPTSTASGDFLIACVAINLYPSGGSAITITAPAGWTKVEDIFSYPNFQAAIMTRVAGGSEPGSWTGSLSSSRAERVTICGTYRGVAGIAVDGQSTEGSGTSLNTATVNNPSSTNWRLVFGGYASSTANYVVDCSETVQRRVDEADDASGAVQIGLWDSGGTIGTGNTLRNIGRGATWECAGSYIAILDNSEGAVATGTLSASLPLLTVSNAANLNYSATMAMNLIKPSMTAAGIATPPEGPLDVVVPVSMSATMYTDASGTLDVIAAPVVNVVAETRAFGIRVITPEAENRTIVPRRGASDEGV